MSTPESRLMHWRTTANAAWAIIGVLILISVAGYGLGLIASAIAPFVLAFILVFLLQGAISWLERKGIARHRAVPLCFGGGAFLLILAFVVLLPPIGRQLAEFAGAVPGYLTKGENTFAELQQQFSSVVIPGWLSNAAVAVSQSLSQALVDVGNGVAQVILGAGSGVATVVFDLFIGAVVAFWMLRDLPMIRQELITLAGEKYEADLENLLVTVVRVVGGYLKGQTIASLVTGVIAWAGLAILGVPFALVLGVITFVLNYVPYVGPLVAGLTAAVVAGLMVSPLAAVIAVAIVVVAQQVTDLFVTPRVMSEQVDLHPTLVIFSLLVGGALFGFWGMIFAIPVAATGKGLFVYYWERRNQRTLGSDDGALFRTNVCQIDETVACEPSDDSENTEPGADALVKKGSE
jgi:predicted PurR-regulated permease PerM